MGNSPIRGRENDTVGIGFYHLGVSNLPILTLHGFGTRTAWNCSTTRPSITPWFHLTPDLQILDPAQHHTEPALLVGLRARLSF